MKKFFLFIFLFGFICVSAQEKYTILMTGASFASYQNGWFEIGCKELHARALNKAVGAEAIADGANRMVKGTLYSKQELEDADAFVIMHVHNMDVFEDSELKENYRDYKVPFDRSNYAAAYDYVIKKYISDCYNLKFDKDSKYYNTQSGKPVIIVLSTHWHDARPIYNESVRLLAQKWGFPVIEFDRYIGFSKNTPHPVTKQQMSTLYADDNTETIDGVVYGWHQLRGEDKFIQQHMAAIFVDTMKKVLPIK
ncbi:DUF5040 domain-containing protein [Dysgonomonas alginatilytica]|nr:DUF5040 domain-containing protein [Dysgonomonas alginatilytica]